MKEIKRVLIILLIMIMPIYVNAAGVSNYSDGHLKASSYINKGNFKSTRE